MARLANAFKILRVYAICAVAYLALGVAVSFLKPQSVKSLGEAWCFDDWCLTVNNVSRAAGPVDVSYRVERGISSRAGRISQRAHGAWIYLIDGQGRRYSPDPDPSAVPLDVLLQPNESVSTSRIFHVPNNVGGLGVITGHGSPYGGPMAFVIIGAIGCLFDKPTMVRFSEAFLRRSNAITSYRLTPHIRAIRKQSDSFHPILSKLYGPLPSASDVRH